MEINRYQLFSYGFVVLIVIFAQVGDFSIHTAKESKPIKHSMVKSWADKLGVELWHLGDFITRRKEVQDSFKAAQVLPRMGPKILENIVQEIKYMMEAKISAVRRIMDATENTAMSHQDDPVIPDFQYYNAKEMLEPHDPLPPNITNRLLEDRSLIPADVPISYLTLAKSKHFFNIEVNTSMSCVHVPTNVFDRSEEVLKAIQWSEKLDNIFLNNYQKDPTLSWQFFGSTTGFMRQFPAAKWKSDPVDLYDARLRSWYIEAATSPKDIVILVDISGSMTGQRKDIARHVVYNILDTLGTNDFVNIYKFSETVEAVVPCFNETLVQATMANVRELKMGLEEMTTDKIANYSAALTKGFEILETYRLVDIGARCNQAIMMVSDGVPYDFHDIYEMYNWQNSTYKPVRIFTYLIGREVADVKKIKEMACLNQGYYVHLSTLAEVREQVLKYIPVMARPLVLGRHDHPVIWTQFYADVIDPQMTDWNWEVQECHEQKVLFEEQRKDKANFNSPEERDRRYEEREKRNREDQYATTNDKYKFMTTVSMPVYDRRENANITEDVLINEAYWVTITRETSIANLLGVAGTDVPIKDILKLMMPFTLGVNGYAFIVTNNGFLLTHPDLRPFFQGILKPAYNSIDMIEVELLDDDTEPREFAKMLLEIREQIINQTTGSKYMQVKYHMDNMKRVSRTKRQYYWTAIPNSPFTLVITYPEQYGLYRVQIRYEDEIHRIHAKGNDVLSFFSGRHWKIHPDWIYCKQSSENLENLPTPEAELLYFLNRIKSPGWKWKDRSPPPPEHAALYSNSSTARTSSFDKDSYFCDRSLIQELVFDAKVTEWFSRNVSFNPKDDKGPSPIAVLIGLLPRNELKLRFGITVAFLATHSGLTRWMEFHTNMADEVNTDQDFSKNNNRAIDEIWYKRAVEQHFVEPQSFVFSVPFEAGDKPDTLVTATHAIFHTEEKKSAPVAVVGFQFQHSAMYTLFKNITSNCAADSCEKTCFSDEVDCFVLDNNGYVIISPNLNDTGKFFGEVRGTLMARLISEKVYQPIRINDYQAVCFKAKNDGSPGNILQTPFKHIVNILQWLAKIIAWSFLQLAMLPAHAMNSLDEYALYDFSTMEPLDNREPPSDEKSKQFDNSVIINRTRLQPCDRTITLYTLYSSIKNKTVYRTPAHGCERPFVVLPIPSSNLILLVVDSICPADPHFKITTAPYEQDTNESLPCYRSTINLRRRRPPSCINRHINESLIEDCGRASSITISIALIGFLIILGKIL